MLNRLNLGSHSWVCALELSSFGGSMGRVLTTYGTLKRLRNSSLSCTFFIFRIFLKKIIIFYLSFIILIIIAILLQLSFIIFDYRIRPFTYSRIPSIEVSDYFFQHRLKLFMDKICYHILEFYSACAGLKQTFSNS